MKRHPSFPDVVTIPVRWAREAWERGDKAFEDGPCAQCYRIHKNAGTTPGCGSTGSDCSADEYAKHGGRISQVWVPVRIAVLLRLERNE